MVATLERMNIKQKAKTIVEENSVLAKDFFSKPKHNEGGQFFHARHGGYPNSIAD
jgi:hypothetical protein